MEIFLRGIQTMGPLLCKCNLYITEVILIWELRIFIYFHKEIFENKN